MATVLRLTLGDKKKIKLFRSLRYDRTLLTDGAIVFFSLCLEGDEQSCQLGDTITVPQGKISLSTLDSIVTRSLAPWRKLPYI